MAGFGTGMPEGAMQAIQEAISRRGGGEAVPALSQVSTGASATQAPPTMAPTGAAISMPQGGGSMPSNIPMPPTNSMPPTGGGEAQTIIKAMSKRLELLPPGA